MTCPKCHSPDIYRKDPRSLTVYCQKCNQVWQAKQSLKPLLVSTVYSSKPPKGNHHVTVWHCPINPSKYSFSVTFGAGVVVFEEFEEHPYNCGQFDTAEEALNAGIKYVKED